MIRSIAAIGTRETDTATEKLRHGFLVYMGLLMGAGGLVWGTMTLYSGRIAPSAIPYGYTLLTAVNFIYFHFSKNFAVTRFIQMLMSLLLPFMFQWALLALIRSHMRRWTISIQ